MFSYSWENCTVVKAVYPDINCDFVIYNHFPNDNVHGFAVADDDAQKTN